MPEIRNLSYTRYFLLTLGLVVFLYLFSLIFGKNVVYADWYVDVNGNLVYQKPGEVLGVVYAKEGESGGGGGDDHGGGGGGGNGGSSSGSGGGSSSGSSSSRGGSGGNPSGGSSGGSTSGGTANTGGSNWVVNTSKLIVKPQSVKPTEIEKKEVEKKEAENETENEIEAKNASESTKIKTETENSRIKKEIESGGLKVKIEQKDGKLKIKGEAKDGSEIELGDQEVFKVEERLDDKAVKIATGSGNSFVFARGAVGAQTNFPLSVDLSTNALTVTTPAGTKVVTILPDTAVQNLLTANVINRLVGPTTSGGVSGSVALKGVGDIVQLELKNGLPVYAISGISNQKILGFIPVEIHEKVIVSAETGALVTKEETPLNSFLDMISF